MVHNVEVDTNEHTRAPLDRLTRELRRRLPDVVAVYVFGSRARGDATADSDFDLAVLPLRPLDPVGRWELQEALARVIGVNVDLVDLTRASTVLRVEILRDGRLLFENDEPARELFEATALGAYARLNDERREILADIARNGRVHE
jgi:predicted nucleotidyltransferase